LALWCSISPWSLHLRVLLISPPLVFVFFFYFIYNGNFLCFKQAAHCFLFVTGDWRLESALLAAISYRFGLGITVERCSSPKFIRCNIFFILEKSFPQKLLVSGNRVD